MSDRTRCQSMTRSRRPRPVAAGSGGTVANPCARWPTNCLPARRWRSRWLRCPRFRSSSASPRCSRCASASPRMMRSTATMVRLAPATSFATPARPADPKLSSFSTRQSTSFPALEARERSRARRAARFRARPPIPHLRVHTTPLSHSAFRLTPFPIPSSRAAAPPPPRGATSPGLLNRRVLHRPTRGFALDPGVVHDSVRGGSRHRSIRPVPPPKRGSTPSLEANAMWERTLAERSANSARTDPPAAAPPAAGVRAGVPSPAPRDSEEEARTRAPRYPARAYSNETPRAWTPYTSTMRASGMQPRRPRPHPRPRQGPRISPRRGPRMSPPRR